MISFQCSCTRDMRPDLPGSVIFICIRRRHKAGWHVHEDVKGNKIHWVDPPSDAAESDMP